MDVELSFIAGGIKSGTDTLEGSLIVPYKVKYNITI